MSVNHPVPGTRILAVLLAAVCLVSAIPAGAAPFRETLDGWITRIEARATELEAAPPVVVTRIGAGATLKKGESGERVGRLTARLVELGHLAPEQLRTIFDDTVDSAVRAFQLAQGLKPDGRVGDGTRRALDRTPQEAAHMMRQSAASMRGFRDSTPASVLFVNLPNQTVSLVRNDELELTMRAVVGRPSRETPLLEDRITHIIVNPTWTVPPTVLKQDKLPMLRQTGTPGIQHATVYLDGEPVPPEAVDWSQVTPGRVRIVQQPGNHNALGRFRFNLTNPFNIYLHGTNEPHLFDREVRTISSGCVRLQDSRKLAELLLAEVGVTPQKIDAMLATGEPQWVKVNSLPVRFVYWTATVDADGIVRLHHDVYDMMDEVASRA
ncbi:MAG TPA: L,D-transpeptidase family protein [Azospirillum sp.]